MTICEICHRSVEQDGITVYRVNEMGVPGRWRCLKDLDVPPDAETRAIVQDLEEVIADLARKAV